jgi:PIN domain nuclease of toxin-antitoxin system
MAFLLDTHVLIWYLEDNKQLTSNVVEVLEDVSQDLRISTASLWEMSIKIGLKKLNLTVSFQDLQGILEKLSIKMLPISFEDMAYYVTIPLHHRDPFDRILVAQAANHSLTLISRDDAFDAYPIERIWR